VDGLMTKALLPFRGGLSHAPTCDGGATRGEPFQTLRFDYHDRLGSAGNLDQVLALGTMALGPRPNAAGM
jgi:hypothetical protein